MSWSPDVFIGELRPWPDTVRVVRGKTDETRRYVPESECYKLQDENDRLWDEFCKMNEWHSKELADAIDENAKLRELCRHLYICNQYCDREDSGGGCSACPYQPLECDCGFEERLLELGIEVDS